MPAIPRAANPARMLLNCRNRLAKQALRDILELEGDIHA
jgi:hypothetical protein